MLPSVGGLEDPTLATVTPERTEGRHVDHVGIFGVDGNGGDPLRAIQPDGRPAITTVGRLIHARTHADAIARPGLSGTGVEGLRCGGRNG